MNLAVLGEFYCIIKKVKKYLLNSYVVAVKLMGGAVGRNLR